jgi:hypothetical protein
MKPENKAIKMDKATEEVHGNGAPDDRPTMTGATESTPTPPDHPEE